MKKHILRLIILIFIMSLVIGMSTMAFANKDDLGGDVIKGIQTGKGLMDNKVTDVISNLSNDIFKIVRYIVIAYLVIKAFSFFSQFSNAGDNPQLKASLKTKLLYTGIGLVLALNFWNIYNFIANTIEIKF